MLSDDMKTDLLLVARADAEKVHTYDIRALDNQRDEKERKEEVKLKDNIDRATELLINAI